MTAQVPERLLHQEQAFALCSEPLEPYFELGGRRPRRQYLSTALARGYIGTWELREQRLYLIELAEIDREPSETALASVFPGFPDRVFAHWYSGTLRVPQGKQIKYFHGGYESVFERDWMIDISHGVVIRDWVRTNGIAEPGAPEGYGVALQTITRRDGSREVRG